MEKLPVYQVDIVRLELSSDDPPRLLVVAEGQVDSPGWESPELQVQEQEPPPEDGILEVRFIAEPPPYVRMPSFYPVTARLDYGEMPDWLEGMRVITASNQMVQRLSDSQKQEPAAEAAA